MRFTGVFLCYLCLLLISYPRFVYSESDIFLHEETGLRIAVVEQDRTPKISITWNGDVIQFRDQYHLFSPSRLVVEFESITGESFSDVREKGNDILTRVILNSNSKRLSLEIYLGTLLQKCTGFTPVITANVLTAVCETGKITSETKISEEKDLTSLALRMGRRERQLNRLLNRIEREHSRRTESGEITITIPFFLSGLIFFSWLLILILLQRRTIRKLKFATLRLPEKMRKTKNTSHVFKTLEVPQAEAIPLPNLHSCYTLLGASPEWGDEELKNHYRMLIRKYHPDYLLNRGFSEDMIVAFADRYRDIQQSYETIMTTRAILRNQEYHR